MTDGSRAAALDALERLLTVCSDGVEGYRLAAANVRTPHLRTLLQRNEVEREEIASVLTNALVELGGKPDHGGSLKGAVHRKWVGALGTTHADEAIVRECMRGDQATLVAVVEALSHDLPADMHDRLRALLARVGSAATRLSASEETRPHAAP